jgi:hypothetical protein
MRTMYGTAGREDIDSLRYDPPRHDLPRYDPPRRDLQASGSSSQGSSSQSNQRSLWQSRYGQGISAFPGSRIIPARAIDAREAAYRRTIQFATVKVLKLTKTTLVNTEVHLFIQYIQQLLRQEAFDESVMGNMIDTDAKGKFIENKTVKGKKTKRGISIIEDKTIEDFAKTATEKHIEKLIK